MAAAPPIKSLSKNVEAHQEANSTKFMQRSASFDAYRVFGVHAQDTECYIVQTSSENGGMSFDVAG